MPTLTKGWLEEYFFVFCETYFEYLTEGTSAHNLQEFKLLERVFTLLPWGRCLVALQLSEFLSLGLSVALHLSQLSFC